MKNQAKSAEQLAKEYAREQWGHLGHSGTRLCQQDFIAGYRARDIELAAKDREIAELDHKLNMIPREPTRYEQGLLDIIKAAHLKIQELEEKLK